MARVETQAEVLTCIGNPDVKSEKTPTNFTFFLNDSDRLNSLVRRYWDTEEPIYIENYIVNPEETFAKDTVATSLTFENGRYAIGMPWKRNKNPLSNNDSVALHCLQNTEKKLQRSPELAEVYTKILQTYEKEGYIHKVPRKEKEPDELWYLPHFPVLRPDKSTTKTRILFDASPKFNGMSLNDIVVQTPE